MSRYPRIQFGFSSIGFPEGSLKCLASLAEEFGLDFIELRALGGTVDLGAYFDKHPNDTLPLLSPNRSPVRLVATNLHLIDDDEATFQNFLRTVDVATKLHAPFVRVFGGKKWGESLNDQDFKTAIKTVERARHEIKTRGATCELLLETHSAFSSSSTCLRLNTKLIKPLSILWDTHHTWRNAGESPQDTWSLLGPLVRHIHFSDSRKKANEAKHQPVLPGTGEYPMRALGDLLAAIDYSLGISLEWEKLWHPELIDLRFALQRFQAVFAQQ